MGHYVMPVCRGYRDSRVLPPRVRRGAAPAPGPVTVEMAGMPNRDRLPVALSTTCTPGVGGEVAAGGDSGRHLIGCG